MKKFLLSVLIAVCSLVMLAACTQTNEPQPSTESYTVELSETSLTLDVYEKRTVTAVVKDSDGKPAEKEIEWQSSQNSILTVEGGELFAKSIGTAKVTVQVKGESAKAELNVTVNMNGYVPALRLSEEQSLTIAAGSSFNLNPKVVFKGKDATDGDTTFTYSVTDNSVATVTDGTVSALKAGSTQITVTASWRGLGGPELTGSEDAIGLRITLNLTVLTVE